jgi:hypothetical protein
MKNLSRAIIGTNRNLIIACIIGRVFIVWKNI